MMLKRETKPWVLVMILAVIIALSGGYALATFFQRANVAQAGEQRAKDTTAEIAGPASSLATEVKAACEEDDADTLVDLGINCGSADQTADAIDRAPNEVVTGPVGARGPVGPTGPGVALSQIRAAIAAYCDARGECVGPAGGDGTDGSDGADGSDSTVAGPRGPAGINGTNGAKGDAGAAGRDGSNGAAGRGISALDCTGTLTPITLTLTYTDGTTSSVTCQPGAVEPEPTPEPTE